MRFLKPVLPVLIALLIGSCAGFTPLYSQNTGARQHFEQLSMEPIEGRTGFLFTQAMRDRGGVGQGQSGAYVLQTTLKEKHANIGVRIDQVSTRSRLTVIAYYLVRGRDGKIAYRGTAQSTAAYDEPDQPYAALAAEQDAEDRASRILAEKVLNDLAVFFSTVAPNS